MSYPQFNLTTLQLPAPASNMTKAEYKTAYGIDLDQVDIKAFKLVLLGQNKYAIDQIKEIEDGYEIYFNGRVLSITDIVQTSDEIYDVANSKPIYCHPVNFSSENYEARLTCLIFDNSPTAYNATTFVAKVVELCDAGASIQVNGYFKDSNLAMFYAYTIQKQSDEYKIYGSNSSGRVAIALSDLSNMQVSDGVNKIN